jgi:hypothetical protein
MVCFPPESEAHSIRLATLLDASFMHATALNIMLDDMQSWFVCFPLPASGHLYAAEVAGAAAD